MGGHVLQDSISFRMLCLTGMHVSQEARLT